MRDLLDRAVDAEARAEEAEAEATRLKMLVYTLLGDGDPAAGLTAAAMVGRVRAAEQLVNEVLDATGMPAASFRLPDGWESRARAQMAAARTAEDHGLVKIMDDVSQYAGHLGALTEVLDAMKGVLVQVPSAKVTVDWPGSYGAVSGPAGPMAGATRVFDTEGNAFVKDPAAVERRMSGDVVRVTNPGGDIHFVKAMDPNHGVRR